MTVTAYHELIATGDPADIDAFCERFHEVDDESTAHYHPGFRDDWRRRDPDFSAAVTRVNPTSAKLTFNRCFACPGLMEAVVAHWPTLTFRGAIYYNHETPCRTEFRYDDGKSTRIPPAVSLR